METKEIAIEGPLNIAGTRVYVAAEVQINCTCNDGRLACFGARKPAYVVILSDSGTKAFTAGGEEITIEQLTAEVPGIDRVLGA